MSKQLGKPQLANISAPSPRAALADVYPILLTSLLCQKQTLGCSVIITVSSNTSPDCLIGRAWPAKLITALRVSCSHLPSLHFFWASTLPALLSRIIVPCKKGAGYAIAFYWASHYWISLLCNPGELLSPAPNYFNYRWYWALQRFKCWERYFLSTP